MGSLNHPLKSVQHLLTSLPIPITIGSKHGLFSNPPILKKLLTKVIILTI
jgi:hypothetical protein